MKINSLVIKNIGIIGDATITVDKPLLVFYGEVRQGKSTILEAVKWVLGGSFPDDIIKHGQKEASIELNFDGGMVARSWYRTKATEEKPSEIKARPVQFIRAGKPVANPATELKRLVNPFVLDQDFLRDKSEVERKTYFAELFAVDTLTLDTELFNVARKAQDLRAKLTGYGDIDLTEVKPVDVAGIRAELASVRTAHTAAVIEAQTANGKADRAERETAKLNQQNAECLQEIARLNAKIREAQENITAGEQLLKMVDKAERVPMPSPLDTSALETKLQNAAAQNVRAETYKKNLERDSQRKADEAALKAAEDRGRAIKKEKIAALAKVATDSGVPGLEFAEDGSFAYEGTAAGMLSTSQIMRLSSAISALYPAELGIHLVDRGESLGRSIFDYVKHAEEKKVSVLATVVGQKPAEVPANVGVFVVSDGIVLKEEEPK